ncbi:MAG: hypothetical protein JNK25_11355 [Phycisphaerae bacterium]|nr:hypothetical protein [Phycisphaerae bacterium]
MTRMRSLVPIAAVIGLLHTIHAADEVTVTFRWAVTAANGLDTLDAPVVHASHDAGTAITIAIPEDYTDEAGLHTVRVVQISTADPTAHSIGHVTITGTRDPFNTLRVLIAPPSSSGGIDDFDNEQVTPVPPGCLHWAGLHGSSGLADTIMVCAAVNGSITGSPGDSVAVGQVFRLQATQIGTNKGQLTIPVSASMYTDALPMFRSSTPSQDGRASIGYIVMSDRISADIAAVGSTANNYDVVFIGGDTVPLATGISGRIVAQGNIGTIQSIGPITTSSSATSPGISAHSVGAIIVGTESQPNDIETHVKVGAVSASGILYRMTIHGDLTEPVDCTTLGELADSGFGFDTAGIRVYGTIRAPVTVAHRLSFASIIAEDIDADITIGHSMQGHIHATGGDINSLTIGYGTTQANSGMWGTQTNTAAPERHSRCLIAADTIEHLDISQVFSQGGDTEPWILADAINVLTIGSMYWGEIKEDPDGPHSAHYPYVVFGQADIAETFTYNNCGGGVLTCPDEHVTIWCEDFDTFDIAGDHGGEVRFSHLAAGRVFRIGGDLYKYRIQSVIDATPGYSRGDHNALSVDQPAATEGVVVVNAQGAPNPDPELHGYSTCALTLDEGTLRLTYDTPGPASLPEYQTPSVDVGGGAVGLAPFYLYDEDCDPVSGATGTDALLQSEFDNVSTDSVPTRPIIVRFYGPVRTDLVSDSPVDLYLRKVLNNTISFTRMPSDSYTVEVNRPGSTGANREIRLYGAGQYRFSSGQYHIRPRESGPPQLYCDFVKFNPAVRDFDYIFDLRLDCDYDGTEDQPWECGVICAAGDFNQDGGADGADVEAFFIAWEAGGC